MGEYAKNDRTLMATAPEPSRSVLTSRLKAAVKSAGGPTTVSRRSGVPESTLNKWLAGSSEPSALSLTKVAEATSSSMDYLVGISPKSDRSLRPEDLVTDFRGLLKQQPTHIPVGVNIEAALEAFSEFVAIPRLEVRAAAGSGIVAYDTDTDNTMMVREAWLRSLGISPGNAHFLVAEGDSMKDTIHDGDLLLVDRGANRPQHGYIYVFAVHGDVVVKRYHRLIDGSVTLLSDNERYPSETVPSELVSNLVVEGRVKWFGRAL